MTVNKVVYDSNVFVAAAFNPHSSSARLVEWVRAGRLRLIWHTSTQQETRYQLKKIPPLSWEPFAGLFAAKNQFEGELPVARYTFIADPDDRKFAALAEATRAMLVTNDEHLLAVAVQLSVPVLAPRAAVEALS
jgi:predicted nucleic acid-binding protein